MKKAFGDYRYLTGSARTRGSLWAGPDHLLYIESQGFLVEFSESYRRIDYSKIQAFTYGRTRTWAVTITWQVILATLCALPFVYWFPHRNERYYDPSSAGFAGIGIVVCLITVVALIINLIKGPTCICKVQTAVQSLKLKPVMRVRQARKLAEKITALCLQHQEAAPLPAGEGAVFSYAEASPAFSPAALLQTKAPFTGSPLMLWGFLLLLVGGCMTAGEVFVDSLPYFVADISLAGGAGIMLVVALLRSARVNLPPALKGTLWAVAANYGFSLVLAFGIYMYGSIAISQELIKAGRRTAFQDDVTSKLLHWMSHAGFKELDWCAWLLVLVGGLNIVFALLGLPSVLRHAPAVVVMPPPLQGAPAAPVREAGASEYEPPPAS